MADVEKADSQHTVCEFPADTMTGPEGGGRAGPDACSSRALPVELGGAEAPAAALVCSSLLSLPSGCVVAFVGVRLWPALEYGYIEQNSLV